MDNFILNICLFIVRFYWFLVYYIESTYDDIYLINTNLDKKVIVTPVSKPVLYENKYLDKFRQMKSDAIFTSCSKNMALYNIECKSILQNITEQKEIICDWNNHHIKTNLKSQTRNYIADTFTKDEYIITLPDQTYSESESESESESDPNNKDNFEHIQNTCIIDDVCYNVDKIQPILNKTLETLNTEISNYPSPKLLLDAQNTICTTVLDKYLINSFIIDSTPVGNVLMRYSAVKLTFEYFSDKTVPRRFLETLARKYVVTFHCPHLYIDTNAEIAQITLSNNVENTTAKLVKDEKVLNKSKQIFAKLKPYNVKPSSRSATTSHAIMAMKGRSKDSTTPFQFKLNDDNAEKINSKVMQNKSTSFTFIDRLSGFNPLQKKPVDKKASMTFAEYKTSLKV